MLCEKRDALQKYLKKFKIQSLVYYNTPLHLHKGTRFLGYKKGDFPKAEKFSKKVLSFPHHQNLKKSEIEFLEKLWSGSVPSKTMGAAFAKFAM